MQWEQPTCPECGERARGRLEVVQAEAMFNQAEDGSYEFAGESEIYWDDQKPIPGGELQVLLCHEGHEWHTALIQE